MKKKNIKIPFAKTSPIEIHSACALVPARSADKGRDYFCPDCNNPVRRRVSSKGLFHFYHNDTQCSGTGLETITHLLAKEVITKEKELWLPDFLATYEFLLPRKIGNNSYEIVAPDSELAQNFRRNFSNEYPAPYEVGFFSFKNHKPTRHVSYDSHQLKIRKKLGTIKIAAVRVETWLNDMRPDLIVTTVHGTDIIVEIAHTHFVDLHKLEKIRHKNLPSVEIHTSHLSEISYQSVKEFLTNPHEFCTWLHMPGDFVNKFEKMKSKFEMQFISEQQRKYDEEIERRKAFLIEQARKQKNLDIMEKQVDDLRERGMLVNLPELRGGTAKQITYAILIRQERIKKFGTSDLMVQKLIDAKRWVDCKKKKQLLYPQPYCMSDFFDKEARLQWEDSKKKDGLKLFRQTVDHLSPKPRTNIEYEKSKGDVIQCPKCFQFSYQFKELVPSSYYARICSICNHSDIL